MHTSTVLCLLFACIVSAQIPVRPRVAFRLDDIQDFFVVPAQIAVMEKFKEAGNIPLSIGIIGGPDKFGLDPTIVSYVRDVVLDTDWEVEIVSHGNQHEDFEIIDFATTVALITEANNNIKNLLPIDDIITFIPPFNRFNDQTQPALASIGFKYFSSQVQIDTLRPYELSGQDFYRFPIQSATNNLANDFYFEGIPAADSLQLMKDQIAVDGFAAVMMHPQEFAERLNGELTRNLNLTQLVELENLLQLVLAEDWDIVPLGRLNTDAADTPLTGPGGGYVPPKDCNCVAFRVEQIQDFFLSIGTKAILDVFAEGNDPITLGIIANSFGEEFDLKAKVQNAMANPAWEIEIANNGFTYEFFTNASWTLADQTASVAAANNKINTALGVTPTTFIPPFNAFNLNTIEALKANQISHMSATSQTDYPPYNLDNGANLWRFPSNAQMSDQFFNPIPVPAVVEAVLKQRDRDGFSVISLFPQNFVQRGPADEFLNQVNETRVQDLRTLIQNLKAQAIRFVIVGRIEQFFPGGTTGGDTGFGVTGTVLTETADNSAGSLPLVSKFALLVSILLATL